MGHSIQAIIAPSHAVELLCWRCPQLVRVETSQGLSILPVEAAFVDSAVAADEESCESGFQLLTRGFHQLLSEMSSGGSLAYVETDYFGGVGGQGAVVYSGGSIVMGPEWSESGVINKALKRLGIRRGLVQDEFSAIGLDAYRSNEDLAEAARQQQRQTERPPETPPGAEEQV